MVMTLFLHTKTPGGKLCFCYSQPIENGILNTWHQVTVTFSEANSIWKYFHFQQSKGQVIIRWRWPINNTNTAGYYLPFWKLTAYSAIKKGFYFCFDPLVCVSPPSGRVCIILPKDTMCLQRGLPHVDNVLGQKNVVFRVSRQTLDFFLHFEKK